MHIKSMSYLDCMLKEALQVNPNPRNLPFANNTTIIPRGGRPKRRLSSIDQELLRYKLRTIPDAQSHRIV